MNVLLRNCWIVRAMAALLSWILVPTVAHAADRFALVIGNQAYNDKVGPLRNAHNDIMLVGKALADVGFTVLNPRKDATRDEILFAVHELSTKVHTPNAVSFLYYAGHGVAVNAENVLIPTNAEDTTDAMLRVRGVKLSEILDILRQEAPEAVHFVVLDACRNTLRGQRGARGFAPVNDRRTGVVVAFSTAQGETASDNGAKNAPYAISLAQELIKPGRNDLEVFSAVRLSVYKATNGQTPWTHDGLIGERVVFKPAPAQPVTATVSPSQAQPRLSEAAEAWDRAKDATNVGVLELYAKRFNDTFYAELARARIDELKKQQVAVAAPAPEAKPAPLPEAKPAVELAPVPAPAPGTVFRDCPDCPEMVVVPAGSFTMGSPSNDPGRKYIFGDGVNESPQHPVRISKPFGVGRFEVTFTQWDACVSAGGCQHKPSDQGWGRGMRPVINVSWNDITNEYLPWLSQVTGKTYRLLTEAEWEYAARAGTITQYAFGTWITKQQATFSDVKWGSSEGTTEVGRFKGNAFGLHDMHGNASEWVEDCYGRYSGTPSDGSAVTSEDCTNRVVRGGSWNEVVQYLRSAGRSMNPPYSRTRSVGFRLARTL